MDKSTAVNKIIKWWKNIQNYKNYMYGLEMCSYYEDEYDYENNLTDNLVAKKNTKINEHNINNFVNAIFF